MLSLELELVLLTLANAFIRHVVTLANVKKQFSAQDLSTESTSLPFGERLDFYVNAAALAHGILYLKRAMKKLGLVETRKMQPSNGISIISNFPWSGVNSSWI
jgi:hypothetical protein